MTVELTSYELALELGRLCKARGMMVATAESCTAGGVGFAMTTVPGSSEWFDRGFITYTNRAKQEMLGVSGETLAQHGAVSSQTAEEMAVGAIEHSQAQASVSVTGIAGPGGEVPGKPVGTVFMAWCKKGEKPIVERHLFSGDRNQVRESTVRVALEGLMNLINH